MDFTSLIASNLLEENQPAFDPDNAFSPASDVLGIQIDRIRRAVKRLRSAKPSKLVARLPA